MVLKQPEDDFVELSSFLTADTHLQD